MSWEFVQRGPARALRGYVRSYTGYSERTAGPLARREVPTGDVTLILSQGSVITLPEPHTSFLAGLGDRATIVGHDGFQEGIQVRLTPLGAHALVGRPMHELTNRAVALEELIGTPDWVERLWELPDWRARFNLLDESIGRAAESGRRPSRGVAWAWGRLRATDGRAAVGGLAAELGWSHRRLIGRFREQVGLPPKTAARLLRFERAAGVLLRAADPRLAELALDCGYYDQAHLNRDFREFAGVTPTEYRAARLPDLGGVKFVQDAGPAQS